MEKEKIYLDNAATSFPKPEEVPRAIYDYMTKLGTNVNRGGYPLPMIRKPLSLNVES